MPVKESHDCPSSLALETYFLEEGTKSPSLQIHIHSCASCQLKMMDLKADREAFLIQHPFSSFWETVEKKRKRKSGFLSHFFQASHFRAAIAMASISAMMILAIYSPPSSPPKEQKILIKGGPQLSFFVAGTDGEKAIRGINGSSLPHGSGIQFIYSTSPQTTHLLLIGVEEDHLVSIYYPLEGQQSGLIPPGENQILPQALRWSPQTKYERFYAIFSEKPVLLDEAQKAVDLMISSGKDFSELEELPLPYPQSSVILYSK